MAVIRSKSGAKYHVLERPEEILDRKKVIKRDELMELTSSETRGTIWLAPDSFEMIAYRSVETPKQDGR